MQKYNDMHTININIIRHLVSLIPHSVHLSDLYLLLFQSRFAQLPRADPVDANKRLLFEPL